MHPLTPFAASSLNTLCELIEGVRQVTRAGPSFRTSIVRSNPRHSISFLSRVSRSSSFSRSPLVLVAPSPECTSVVLVTFCLCVSCVNCFPVTCVFCACPRAALTPDSASYIAEEPRFRDTRPTRPPAATIGGKFRRHLGSRPL